MTDQIDTLQKMGQDARAASRQLKTTPRLLKDLALEKAAELFIKEKDQILEANKKDMAAAAHLSDAQKDRLMLDENRIKAMANALKLIASLPDPVGEVMDQWDAPSGIKITRKRVPIGVIGIIYESRPNVTSDAAALCLKAGNACILRPGSDSLESSLVIAKLFATAIKDSDLPEKAVQIISSPDRALVGELLRMKDHVDLIIPRGGKSLIKRVDEDSRIPVLAHLEGLCHLYIDKDADLEMAQKIALNAKMRRTGICGATETMLIHKDIVETHLKPILDILHDAGCAIRGDEKTCAILPYAKPATEEDWRTEYLDAILSVRVVDNIEAAINHIETYSSHHTESIVTNSEEAMSQFFKEVDSAIVMHNASTQFADGGEFGMGAEIGIATGRLHARGPVGLQQLTTFKYVLQGQGHVRS